MKSLNNMPASHTNLAGAISHISNPCADRSPPRARDSTAVGLSPPWCCFAWGSKQLLTWALQCASALTRGSRPVPCLCFRLWSQPHGAARLHHGYAGRQRYERDDLCGRLRLHDCGRRRVPRSPFVCCLRLSSCFKSASSRSSTRTPGLNAAALTLSHGALAGRRGAVLHDGLREEDG